MRPRLHSFIEQDVSTVYWPLRRSASRPHVHLHGPQRATTIRPGEMVAAFVTSSRTSRPSFDASTTLGARAASESDYGLRHRTTTRACSMTTTSTTRSLFEERHGHRRRRDHLHHTFIHTPHGHRLRVSDITGYGIQDEIEDERALRAADDIETGVPTAGDYEHTHIMHTYMNTCRATSRRRAGQERAGSGSGGGARREQTEQRAESRSVRAEQ